MRLFLHIVLYCCAAVPLAADIAVAARNIRPGAVLTASDIILMRGEVQDGFGDTNGLIGLEAKVALYAGRTILTSQVTRAASVERNQIIKLIYAVDGLSMSTEGRALGRGAEGQRIRVMNLASKASIFGTIQRNGTVLVSK